MQKFKGGQLAPQFPPQRCGPGPPPKVGVAGGAKIPPPASLHIIQ